MRTINSPGVEINERDLSLTPAFPAGTNIFMTGFAAKGPTDEVLQITSVDELEQVYGVPTTPAERYLHYSARQVLQASSGNMFINRLPYGSDMGEGFGSKYGALVYPVATVQTLTSMAYRPSGDVPAKTFKDALTADSDWAALTATGSFTVTEAQSLSTDGLSYGAKYSVAKYAALSATVNAASVLPAKKTAVYDSFTVTPDTSFTNAYSATSDSTSTTYLLGKPKFFELTLQQYLSVLDGTAFAKTSGWGTSTTLLSSITSIDDFGKAGLIVLNTSQTTTNTKAEGYYFGLTDNTNAVPTTNHDSVASIYTVTTTSSGSVDFTEVPQTRLYFALSATNDTGYNRNAGSLSFNIESAFYKFSDSTTDKFDDILAASVYKLRQSPYTSTASTLEFVNAESYLGSLDYYRQIQSQTGGPAVSYYLGGQSEKSQNVKILVNENINSRKTTTWLDTTGKPTRKVRLISHSGLASLQDFTQSYRFGVYYGDMVDAQAKFGFADSLFPLGPYTNLSFTTKELGNVTLKLDRALQRVENDEVFDLDIIAEAGLGTIYSVACACGTSYYDDTIMPSSLSESLDLLTTSNDYVRPSKDSSDLRGNYHAIFSKFEEFCAIARKDCLFIADPIRHILIRGANTSVLADPNKSFSQYIYSALRHNFELANSSYACTYGNWAQINDQFAGVNCWVPFSGWAAADMATTDQNFQPWYAPAGFTRGKVRNAIALAITPKQKERDQLYKISINPVAFFPNEGFNIFGQKTLLKQPSAFDRINVRRLFLYLEKATKKTVKYFIFEPNSLFTRTRVIDTLTPIFELAKNTEGVYDYLIIADNRNNTPTVIDNNELVVDIYLKPVRAAEFILVNFIATRTGANFQELVGS